MNPLMHPFPGPHGLPDFASIRPEHFEPAFAAAMAEHRAELRAIAEQDAAPSFANTVARLDGCGRWLGRLRRLFYNLNASATSPALQAVQRQMAAPLAAHDSAVMLDEALFARIEHVHAQGQSAGLSAELSAGPSEGLGALDLRLLERVHQDFVREGARLKGTARARYGLLMQELAQAYTAFSQNVLHDEESFALPLLDEAALAGLPAATREAAREAARQRGMPEGSHAVSLSRSMVVPFLSFSTRRDLREQLWRAWVARGEHAGEHDNRPWVKRILALRQEQAQLLGFETFAHYALADRMAKTPAAAQALLEDVWTRALAAVHREQQALEGAQAAAGASGTIEAWDWRFWAERVRRARYALDDSELKPYFRLENMVQAAFDCAQRLFGLRFVPQPAWPVYHPDVRAYEVLDAQGQLLGVFLHDNFARIGKRSGAWMSSLREQSHAAPEGQRRPIVLNNNNFAKGEPTLLGLDDVRTLFHELGHGLHGLLSEVPWASLSGTSVLRDFVELPSQLFEHWGSSPEVLKRHALHVQTGQPLPDVLLERLQAARQFNQAYETVRYTASALVDLALHSLPEPPEDPVAWEAAFLRDRGLPAAVGLNHRLVHFQHLFSSDGYAAGYYVYLWAEVLDADGFEAFVEAGDIFDAGLAAALKRHIYASGNSVAPEQAYRAFRGRDAQVQPLLRKRGLLQAQED